MTPEFTMFLKALLLTALVVLDVTFSLPVQDEEKKSVNLNYFCVTPVTKDQHNKSPVLFIHGLGQSLKGWHDLPEVTALLTERKVCAVDLPNHGDSDWTDKIDVPSFTDYIADFIDKLKMEKVNLIGHSLGGMISVRYTLNNPHRVSSLIVEDMRAEGATQKAADGVYRYQQIFVEAMESVPAEVDEDEAKNIIFNFVNKELDKIGFTEKLVENSKDVFEMHKVDGKWAWKMHMALISKSLQDLNNFKIQTTGVYSGPTLFIYGSDSYVEVGKDEETTLKYFPCVKHVSVEGGQHFLHGRFRKFDDEVIKFLNAVNETSKIC